MQKKYVSIIPNSVLCYLAFFISIWILPFLGSPHLRLHSIFLFGLKGIFNKHQTCNVLYVVLLSCHKAVSTAKKIKQSSIFFPLEYFHWMLGATRYPLKVM